MWKKRYSYAMSMASRKAKNTRANMVVRRAGKKGNSKGQRVLRAVKDWELFCPRTPLIKTVMRLFTAASNYSQLWLCSFDYDSHE